MNQEKLSHKLDVKFNEYATMLRQDLDERNMGGNLTMGYFQREVTNPLMTESNSVKAALANLQSGTLAGTPVAGAGSQDNFFTWSNNANIGRALPEWFKLDTSVTPLML